MAESQSSEWQRNDRKSKNFQCPCGKSYLSYPALYTHIKQTHGGKAPGEIKRPDAHTRGRPKTTGNSKIQQHNKSIEADLKEDPTPALVELLSTAQTYKNRQLKDVYENQPVFKLIMNDKDKQFEPKFLKQDNVFEVKMGEGIIEFFKQIQNKIQNKNAYDEIVMLVVLLTQHIIQETEDQNVLNLGTIGLMPEFVNYFIIHDFKKPVERLKLENLWIFQDRNSIKWILYKKYTLTKVEINEKYLNPSQADSQNQEERDDNEDDSQENEDNDESNEEDQKENDDNEKDDDHSEEDSNEQKNENLRENNDSVQQVSGMSKKKVKGSEQVIEDDKIISA